MSDFTPTYTQKQAIDARGSAVLISAGAGSGKTKVLTERLLARILDRDDPCDVDRFLIITFTRAAAAELRGRIMTALAEALAADPMNAHLRRQSALCRRARIGTIHSFCASVLRENAHAAGISPDFRIVDEDRADAMKYSALERVLEERYSHIAEHPDFRELADTVGAGRDDSRLETLVLELYEKMQCHARPEAWARAQAELLASDHADAGDTPWGRELLASAQEKTDYWASELETLIANMPDEDKLRKAYLDPLSKISEQLRGLSRAISAGWERAREFAAIDYGRLGSPRGTAYPEYAELVKARKADCKKAIDAVAASLARPSAELIADLRLTAPAMTALLELTVDFGRAFAKDKRRLALADYSDLEHLTVELLTNADGTPTPLAASVGAAFTEIMVDEYQDVSQVQDAIFASISDGGKKLFLVGDIKQSIYRFRLADPEIFSSKYRTYADADAAAAGEPRRILLRENFRSRREIIDCANSIFETCMSEKLGDVAYDGMARLVFGAAGYEGSVLKPEAVILSASGDDSEDDDTDTEPPDKTELEAAYIASRIRSLIDAGTPVQGRNGARCLEYGDIAILLRAPSSVMGVYSRVLAQYGIPTAAGGGSGYFNAVEVSAMVSMLAVIDNPHQDIPLIAVLRSPAFGFTGDELTAIRIKDKKADFYTALTLAAEDSEKCRAFLALLSELRDTAADLPAAELVWLMLERLDMLAICSAMTDGAMRMARLKELVALAERFEATGCRGLHRFVLWLRKQSEKGREPTVGAGGGAVQLMSMHASKGLEFPVVFLADMAHRFNFTDSRGAVLVHPLLGLGPKVTDTSRRVEYPTLARRAIELRQRRELLSEEMRLLYVGVTRARERLIMVGSVKNAEKKVGKAALTVTSPMHPQLLSQASCMLDWVLSAALADGGRTVTLSLDGTADERSSAENTEISTNKDLSLLPELERRLAFVYPYAGAESAPSKITATELKGTAERDEEGEELLRSDERTFRLPDFTKKSRPLTGAQRGSATHLVLQYMDFARGTTPEGVRGEIERLREKRFLTDKEAEAVDARAISRLFASPTGRRMLSADAMKREFKFSLMVDAPSGNSDQVLLQGVVDCCIEEAGELVIIDYKTDRVENGADAERKTEYYAPQLRAYAGAMERIFSRRVKECVLYFIASGDARSFKP